MNRYVWVFIFAGAFMMGCQASKPKPVRTNGSAQQTMTDPCAMRMHDLSGDLLLYHATYRKLPTTLDDLRAMSAAVSPLDSFVCPVSKQPYIYSPDGVAVAGQSDRLLLYDPTPAHDGKRWAIEVIDSTAGAPLVTKVVSLPEKTFEKSFVK